MTKKRAAETWEEEEEGRRNKKETVNKRCLPVYFKDTQ
jgi:hypothetical protein